VLSQCPQEYSPPRISCEKTLINYGNSVPQCNASTECVKFTDTNGLASVSCSITEDRLTEDELPCINQPNSLKIGYFYSNFTCGQCVFSCNECTFTDRRRMYCTQCS
ncbi:15842_t:CDS:1, partial [Racocetra persica]